MAIYFDNSNIITGSRGPEGPQGIQGKQGPAGPNEISTDTASSITGILKGNGSTVAVAEAGVDYATPEQAKTFVVTFTGVEGSSIITADKTPDEIYTQYELNRNIIGLYRGVIIPLILCQPKLAIFQGLINSKIAMIMHSSGSGTNFGEVALMPAPSHLGALPDSGTALTANTIYAVADAVGTYAFTPPDTGWAHGTFTTGTAPNITFTGKIIGKLPTFEASKQYEFDVLDGAWVVQEVLTQ